MKGKTNFWELSSNLRVMYALISCNPFKHSHSPHIQINTVFLQKESVRWDHSCLNSQQRPSMMWGLLASQLSVPSMLLGSNLSLPFSLPFCTRLRYIISAPSSSKACSLPAIVCRRHCGVAFREPSLSILPGAPFPLLFAYCISYCLGLPSSQPVS